LRVCSDARFQQEGCPRLLIAAASQQVNSPEIIFESFRMMCLEMTDS
jgi:hypothetical protein